MLLGTGPSLHAAADKPDRPSRLDRIERRLERANGAAPASRTMHDGVVPQARALPRAERAGRPVDQTSATGADTSFDAFRLIVERNIFDPSRIARVRRTTEAPQPHVDIVALVGTLQSQKGTVAFFESATPGYRRAVHEGDTLGDFSVQTIQADHVVLVRGGHPLAVRVAEQLRRPEGTDWSVGADVSAAASAATGTATTSAPDTPPAIPANASDVLRRLMEARQKQLKQ